MSQMSLMILLCGLIAIAIIMLTALLIIACAKPDPAERQEKKRRISVGMTYRDLMEILHPDLVRPDLLGGMDGCPASTGYTSHIPATCPMRIDNPNMSWEEMNRMCHACWNREVPEEELHVLMEVETA